MEDKYNKITEQDILDMLDELQVRQEMERKFIVYCVDKRDGEFKRLEETQQFDEALKREANKYLGNV